MIRKLFQRFIEFLYLKQKNNLAYYDSLTGVKNRQYYDRVIRSKYCVKDCTVVFADVDNLKQVNDEHGHLAGDRLIQYVANQISTFNPLEVVRYGGDEFVIIMDKPRAIQLDCASHGLYEKSKFEDMSSAIKQADLRMLHNKNDKKIEDDYFEDDFEVLDEELDYEFEEDNDERSMD